MELIRAGAASGACKRSCAVAIGNFDGVHVGHQALIGRVRALARELAVPAAVLTFEPAPLEFFSPERAPARLMRLRDKFLAIADLGVERLYVMRFNARVKALTPAAFEALLREEIGARAVAVGQGFRYGAGRGGDVTSLTEAGHALGFRVTEIAPVVVCGTRVSSTDVRAALACGNLAAARHMLGRDYRISGRVVEGKRLGRQLGFPTANMRLHRRVIPLYGIYAVRAEIDGRTWPAVASLGTRPTVAGTEPLLETHVFDFDDDLYGRYLSVEFVAKLRDEERFPGLAELVTQMHIDASQARAVLAADAA